MKKLLKKFVILALISTMIGYNAAKDNASENTYTEPTESIESVNRFIGNIIIAYKIIIK